MILGGHLRVLTRVMIDMVIDGHQDECSSSWSKCLGSSFVV
jgi:hypothetical protein